MRYSLALGMILILSSSCAKFRKEIGPVELTPAGQKVFLTKTEADKKCQQLSDVTVTARSGSAGASGYVNNRFRNQAALLGANYAVMDTLTTNGENTLATLSGRSYKCPETEPAAPPAK